jgi:Pentapeptide repeats (8 copies)
MLFQLVMAQLGWGQSSKPIHIEGAQLQGASLTGAQLQGASLKGVFVWRADARKAVWEDTRIVNLQTAPKQPCIKNREPSTCDWTLASYEKHKERIKLLPDFIIEWFEQRLNPTTALEREEEMAKVWDTHTVSSPTLEPAKAISNYNWPSLALSRRNGLGSCRLMGALSFCPQKTTLTRCGGESRG